jgi:hypothetical protein
VTWNNATSGVAWATAGAGDASTDRYSDILDSFTTSDTNSAGWYELNVAPYLQLCDGTDTANYKGWIITPKQNSASSAFHAFSADKGAEITAAQITVNYCVAGGAPQIINMQVGRQKRIRQIILTPTDGLETSGAQEFANAGDFDADPVIGFIENDWIWGEQKEWSINPKFRVEIKDVEEEK